MPKSPFSLGEVILALLRRCVCLSSLWFLHRKVFQCFSIFLQVPLDCFEHRELISGKASKSRVYKCQLAPFWDVWVLPVAQPFMNCFCDIFPKLSKRWFSTKRDPKIIYVKEVFLDTLVVCHNFRSTIVNIYGVDGGFDKLKLSPKETSKMKIALLTFVMYSSLGSIKRRMLSAKRRCVRLQPSLINTPLILFDCSKCSISLLK